MTADIGKDNSRYLGGTVSYASRVVHAFGLNTGVLTSAAKNEPLVAELEPYAALHIIDADATSTFENVYTPQGRNQYLRGVAAKIGVGDVPDEWRTAPLVHLGPLTDEVDPRIADLFPDATVLVTLQGWLRRWGDDGLVRFKRWYDEAALKAMDILVFSEEDIREAPELEEEYRHMVEHLIVTRSAKGGTYYHKGVPTTYNTPQVEELHPTGAGDIFAAALLCSLPLFNHNMSKALQVAARLAAISVTRFALDGSPTPEEVQQTLDAVRNESNND